MYDILKKKTKQKKQWHIKNTPNITTQNTAVEYQDYTYDIQKNKPKFGMLGGGGALRMFILLHTYQKKP